MKSQRSVTGPQVILSLNGDAPIALRRKSVSDRGFVSTASHFIHVKIASKNLCAAPVEKVVQNRADLTFPTLESGIVVPPLINFQDFFAPGSFISQLR